MATTTNTDVNYQGGPFGGRGGRTGDRSSRGADEEEGRDSDRDKGNHADMDASKRGRAVARLQALPNGEYPIRNASELRAAVKEWQNGLKTTRYSGYEVQRHIIRRARELRMVALLPPEWGVNLEIMREALSKKRVGSGTMNPVSEDETEILMQENFESFLVAEGNNVPYPVILQEATAENNQTMKVRVPFYIGGSINTPPGFTKKVLFPTDILQETVQEGKKEIAANSQPLTVYARHAQAADANNLPIGAVTDLAAEGSIGYATLEVEPTTVGKDVQVLLKGKKLNAVSLRSGKGRFELEDVNVNGERMLRMKSLRISGIDFAPDNPAMKTYGIQILQEDADIKPIKKEEKSTKLENLTLEDVKAKYPDIVSKIEEPLVTRLDEEIKKSEQLKNKNVELEAKIAKADLADYAREIAAKHPKKDEALPVLMEVATECKTREEFASKVFPILMEALSNTAKTPVQPVETAVDKLKKLFNAGSNGHGQTRETTSGEVTQEEEIQGEHVGPLEVPA
jgi:hypothetical protein